jgi:hypothetical protein
LYRKANSNEEGVTEKGKILSHTAGFYNFAAHFTYAGLPEHGSFTSISTCRTHHRNL